MSIWPSNMSSSYSSFDDCRPWFVSCRSVCHACLKSVQWKGREREREGKKSSIQPDWSKNIARSSRSMNGAIEHELRCQFQVAFFVVFCCCSSIDDGVIITLHIIYCSFLPLFLYCISLYWPNVHLFVCPFELCAREKDRSVVIIRDRQFSQVNVNVARTQKQQHILTWKVFQLNR